MELGNIKAVDIVDQMTGAYLDYSMSVIVARALPDVRDGMKPVHRRVLYAMDQMGLQSTKQFRKCAGTVGEVLKSYHPHGDVAVYETLVRMAQPWSMRYPLILGQGNFGSQDDDPPAAMRYCVTGDTLVVTDNGLIPISQISQPGVEDVSVRILSKDGQTNTASKWWDCGEFPTWNVRTQRGYEITGTSNHPLLVAVPHDSDGRVTLVWKTIEQLAVGDHVVMDRNSNLLWPEQPVDLHPFYSSAPPKPRVKQHTLPETLDEDLAFILGTLLAEGTFRKQVIEFTNTHGDFAEHFIQSWKRVFPTCRLHIFERQPVSYGKKPFLQIQIVSQHVIAFIKALGLSGRSAQRQIPEIILRSPRLAAAAFLQGLFEGDGAVEKSGRSLLRLNLTATNRLMLRQAQTLLLRFGIVASLREDKTRKVHRLLISGYDNLLQFACEIGFTSAVKSKALATILKLHTGKALSRTDFIPHLAKYVRTNAARGQREWLSKHNFDRADRLVAALPRLAQALPAVAVAETENLANQRYLFERVESIEYAGKQPVYSVRVDSECHSFVANGFVNHNTEAKMAAIADELLRDIEKDTVDFIPNYDNQTTEPTVFPARLPNLLLNGSTGIAVGMATNIPPHNLHEICNGIIYLIEQPEATTEELARIVRGPDFPTGGIIQGREGIRNMYANGRGRVVVRARTNIEETKGRSTIVVTELPYQVNKAELVKKIAELARDRRIDGIAEVRDESDRQGMRMVIDLKRDANPRSILNSLYKYTAMQSAFNANMLALVDRQPQTLTLKKFLVHYIHHREIVLTRRTRYELAKAEARKHILDGLKIALDNLDTIISTIRRSQRDTTGLSEELQQQFGFSQEQARAVLDMRLSSLAALQRQKIEDELKDVLQHIDYYRMLLSDIDEIRKLIKNDLAELKEKYGDERRSEIAEDEASDFKDEDLIPNEEAVVTLTEKGYIKRLPSSTYRAQRRGGRGVTGMVTREDDAVLHLLITHTHDSLLFFTDRGRVFQLRVYELPDTSRTARGEHLINLISIEQRERVTAIVSVPKGISRDYMIVATKKGEVKKTPMDEFEVVRRNGLIAMKLEDDDELIAAKLVHSEDDVLLITALGRAARFPVADLRSASRMSGGVRGIRLVEKDLLVSLNLAPEDDELLVVSEYGYGKRTPISEYPRHSRGGGGVMAMRVTEKSGSIATARVITELDNDLMIISASGVVIRTDVNRVKTSSRVTQGVHLMNLGDGDTVVAVATTNGKKQSEALDEDEEEDMIEADAEELPEDAEVAESTDVEEAEEPTETE